MTRPLFEIQTFALGQFRLLRQLGSRSWRASVWVIAFAMAALCLLMLGLCPGPSGVVLALAVTMSPLVLVLIWAFNIAGVWQLHPGWFALCGVLVSAVWAVMGHGYAALLLNTVFADNPANFPVARMMASFAGGFIIALGAYAVAAFAASLFGSVIAIPMAIWALPDWRRALVWLGVWAGIALSAGFSRGAVAPVEDLAQRFVRRVALSVDFHAFHRCDMSGWPDGIARVAFVGDAQVLGWRRADDTLHLLHCIRKTAMP